MLALLGRDVALGNSGRGNFFDISTTCRVRASLSEIEAIVRDTQALERWWHAAFLRKKIVAPGGPDLVGRVGLAHTKGFMPWTFQFGYEIVESDLPRRARGRIFGDFEGFSTISFEERGDEVAIRFDWQVEVVKPGIGPLSPLLRWLYAANHLFAMAAGRAGLKRELARRRLAATCKGDAGIRFGKPIFPHNLPGSITPVWDRRLLALAAGRGADYSAALIPVAATAVSTVEAA